jgi:hypothetical protein
MRIRQKLPSALAVVIVISMMIACASEPTIQTGPEAEISFDGLHRVDNSVFRFVWVEPEIDLARYSKILPGPAEFRYRAVRATGQRSSANEFPIADEDRARFESIVSEIFDEELSNSQFFTITDASGPDTLIVVGALDDIVSRVPPQRTGRGDIWISSVGEATLILEIIDSMSGEVLARAVDRRAAQPASRTGVRSSTVSSTAEVRRLARRWATQLRNGLDSFHER